MEENPIGQVLPALIQSLTDSVVNGKPDFAIPFSSVYCLFDIDTVEDAFAVKGILKVMFLRAMMYLIHGELYM